MEITVFSKQGESLRTIELSDQVFGREVNEGAVYEAVKNELANARVGTASTKTRSEVRGSGAKPWRQKGTGRARAGHRRSPIWVGGGVAFGPKPRDYSYSIPKKVKRLAFRSVLSLKTADERLKVVEDFSIDSGKTKDLMLVLRSLIEPERTLLVLQEDDQMLRRAGRNIPWLRIMTFNRLRVHDLFYAKHVLVQESAASALNEFYDEEGRKKRAAEKTESES
ncbi:MAG: 50S ribosomal protein L4 [Spirochaetales bacterium]|nr:50S ribosomal protein L4 [Spirochaetales bacterium]MCF7937786.1 50S ribosomal protein L4 [Spirochaetales bacterium]